MTPNDQDQERVDRMIVRLRDLSAAFLVTRLAHNLVTDWTLSDCEHHLTQLERLTHRLTHECHPTEEGKPF